MCDGVSEDDKDSSDEDIMDLAGGVDGDSESDDEDAATFLKGIISELMNDMIISVQREQQSPRNSNKPGILKFRNPS